MNWLVRQLKNAPDAARVEAFVAHARGSSAAELLVDRPGEPGQPGHRPHQGHPHLPRRAATGTLGTKRGRGRGCVHRLRPGRRRRLLRRRARVLEAWSAAPPKLRPVHAEPPEVDDSVPTSLASTDYSSQDGTQDAEEGVTRNSAVDVTTTTSRDRTTGADQEGETAPHDTEIETNVQAVMSPTGSD